ncbi:hypothetical protein [Streptomyces sp. SPB4]|uniref:hypothetical protein n=1 Tax=Streptomyces sp. SPB4 TaxID=2940553 RepID=UPI002473C566|nr:hypothetical protein [Streptomyces sp. SPB4]MDH6545093.1 hypothetical protein [Streptomyces sp. SPB4]
MYQTLDSVSSALAPSPASIGAVALYAVVPHPMAPEEALEALAAYAAGRGWHVPPGCAVTDSGPLGDAEDLRPGWKRIRRAVMDRQVSGLIVPCFSHVGYHWPEWNQRRTWLLQRGQFVIATDPTEQPACRCS